MTQKLKQSTENSATSQNENDNNHCAISNPDDEMVQLGLDSCGD